MLSPSTLASRDHRLLLERFLSRRSPATRETYLQGLTSFARWLGAGSPELAVSWLFSAGFLEASVKVSAFLDHLSTIGRSPATIGGRLSALRSVVQLGRLLDMIDWALEVPAPLISPLRETRGPGRGGVQSLMRAAMAQSSREKAARDLAILRLLYDLGLRRGEVAGIALSDLDLRAKVVKIKGKGRSQPVPLTLPVGTAEALASWLSWRGNVPGPLFYRLDNAGSNLVAIFPLTGRAVWNMVHNLGTSCGVAARPHGIRHAAITEALDAGFDIRVVQRFSRHKKTEHVLIYDDNRRDLGGGVSSRLSAELTKI